MARPAAVRLHADDDVVIVTSELDPATDIGSEGVITATVIPSGHKLATRAVAKGQPVRRYGQIIGFATAPIEPGDHVHTHNLAFSAYDRDHDPGADSHLTLKVPAEAQATFDGYLRSGGRVGTRNYVGVITTVNCSATPASLVTRNFPADELAQYENIDGLIALTHGTGCGMAGAGAGMDALQRTLWGYATHPNFAGILIMGLGCEAAQISFLLEAWGVEPGPHLRTMTIQDLGGTRPTIDEATAIIREMLPTANQATRSPVPASELTLALQCGGSDAWSGITANPALGVAVDRLVAHGGTAILAETPEIYGAEHLLTRRAVSSQVADKLLARIAWWEDYVARNHGSMDNNPSPGNKAGGLTTILEKSLGAVAKGGTTNLVEVLDYAEAARQKGFVFMDSPGYDPASVTGQVASGANVICFTTGRGSCFGFKPVPSLKLATTSEMFRHMEQDMDLDCGGILDGQPVEAVGQHIFELVLATASGRRSKSELLGFGDLEFTPWQIGAVM
ncbi:MAG: altronate dehydratase [Actinomycetia bacterium]|nr:altronate dehydratase [Actinomycetes bacterium]